MHWSYEDRLEDVFVRVVAFMSSWVWEGKRDSISRSGLKYGIKRGLSSVRFTIYTNNDSLFLTRQQ